MILPDLSNDYYFIKEDYETFLPNKIESNTPEVLKERKNVKIKLEDLHHDIYPVIKSKRWNIDKHNHPLHLTSSIDLNNAYIPNRINSIWLHYGKTEAELKKFKKLSEKETFINHIRLQVIVSGNLRSSRLCGVGTWLVVGKANGGYWDRSYVKQEIRNANFSQKFYNFLINLGNGYFIRINGIKRNVNDFDNEQDFIDFVRTDTNDEYFIIGKDFEPDDHALKSDVIVDTVINEFDKLYVLYDFLKTKYV